MVIVTPINHAIQEADQHGVVQTLRKHNLPIRYFSGGNTGLPREDFFVETITFKWRLIDITNGRTKKDGMAP
jgi:hypothetical protein